MLGTRAVFRPTPGDAPQSANPASSSDTAADSGVPIEQPSVLSPPPVAAELPTLARAKTRSSRLTATGIALGLLGFTAILALLLSFSGHRTDPEVGESEAPPIAEAPAPPEAEPPSASPAALPGGAVLANSPRPKSSAELPDRIAALEAEPGLRLVKGTMQRRSLLVALTEAGVPRAEVYRIIKAFERVTKFARPGRLDAFTVALDRSSRKVKAFEYEASAAEVYQALEDEDGLLRGKKLDLKLDRRRVAAAIVVGGDLAAACRESGLERGIVELLGDALGDRLQLSGLHPKGILRIVAQEESASGKLVRYPEVEAVEYRPPGQAETLRVYRYVGKGERGYFDAKGRAPFKGGWRLPIPFARISSRFNPKRKHPVLRVVKPHNGVDFAAPPGTPVLAPYAGTIETVGRSGPNGNLVTIRHEGGIVTGYAHLSRFAAGLRPGQKVKTRQVIGYVGSTGRSTGPHLHFSAKRKGVFIDPLSLRLDGLRVLPSGERAKFQKRRAELDEILDALPLPSVSGEEHEVEDEPMGEEEDEE